MKNIKRILGIFGAFMIIAILLTGCTSDDEEEIVESEVENEYSYYPVLDKIEKIYIGSAYEPENQIIFVLNDKERLELWQLMKIDEWITASDLPLSLPTSDFSIHEKVINEEHGAWQSWAFREWEGQTLIVPSLPDKDSKKICYFASADVLLNLISFTETLTPFSGE